MAPFGRACSCAQLIVGMLNCRSGPSASTSAPFSLAKGANGRPALGLADRSTGAVSLVAAAQAAGPTFCSTWALVTCWSPVGAASVAVAAGVGVGVGLGALTTSPPPWPPDALGAAAGALPDGFALPLGAALADALGAADGGFSAVCAT